MVSSRCHSSMSPLFFLLFSPGIYGIVQVFTWVLPACACAMLGALMRGLVLWHRFGPASAENASGGASTSLSRVKNGA